MIGMVQRLLRGIATPTETLATGFFEQAGPEGRFLELAGHAPAVPRPSSSCRRGSSTATRGGPGWTPAGLDAYGRARERVEEIMASHAVPALDPDGRGRAGRARPRGRGAVRAGRRAAGGGRGGGRG